MTAKREGRKQERSRRARQAATGRRSTDPAAARKLLESTAEQARQTAAGILQCNDLPARAGALADGARDLALHVIRQSPDHGRHACASGCAFCCHTAVTVAAVEAMRIAQYLQERCSNQTLAEVRRRLDGNAALASCLGRDEYIARKIPCALLTEDGNCRAYSVRPMACAGFLSTSRAACEAEFHAVPGRTAVPTDEFAMLAGLGVSYGLKEACNQAGLDREFYELHHAIRRALDEPDGAAKWLRGHTFLEGCMK